MIQHCETGRRHHQPSPYLSYRQFRHDFDSRKHTPSGMRYQSSRASSHRREYQSTHTVKTRAPALPRTASGAESKSSLTRRAAASVYKSDVRRHRKHACSNVQQKVLLLAAFVCSRGSLRAYWARWLPIAVQRAEILTCVKNTCEQKQT